MLVFSKKLVMDGIYDVFILSVCSITQVRMVNLSYHLFLVGLVLSITNNQIIKKVSIQILCFNDCSAIVTMETQTRAIHPHLRLKTFV